MEKKENKISNKEENLLHSCDTEITLEEYQKAIKYNPWFYWCHVFIAAAFTLILFIFIGKGNINMWMFIVMYIAVMIIVMIYYKLKINDLAEASYHRHFKDNVNDTKFKIEFYEKYFLRISEKTTRKIEYNEIIKITETDTNFYLKTSYSNIIIQKEKCDSKLIEFIKNIRVDKFVIRNAKNKIVKTVEKKKNNNPSQSFQKGMLILFILTIFMPLIADGIVSLLNRNKPSFLFTTSTIVYWILLPIPILSIILGIKYKKTDSKFKKNITAGVIVGFIMFIMGIFSIGPTFEIEYENVLKYQNILGFELPSEGRAMAMHFDHFFVDRSSNYTSTNVYFSEEDANTVYSQILNNNNWILASDLKSELSIYSPAITNPQNVYVSIYNATNNIYNTVPEQSGKFKIYVLTFDLSDKYLSINEYDLEYKK